MFVCLFFFFSQNTSDAGTIRLLEFSWVAFFGLEVLSVAGNSKTEISINLAPFTDLLICLELLSSLQDTGDVKLAQCTKARGYPFLQGADIFRLKVKVYWKQKEKITFYPYPPTTLFVYGTASLVCLAVIKLLKSIYQI